MLLKLKIKKSLSVILAVVFILSMAVNAYAAPSSVLTIGNAADRITGYAADYNKSVSRGDVVKGLGDEKASASRLATVVMLRRAFGSLPEPKGDNLRLGNFDKPYTDVPSWARADVQYLQDKGLLTGKGDGTLGCNVAMKPEELEVLLSRFARYLGTNPKDDFYAFVNRDYLDNAALREGEEAGDRISDIEYETRKKIEKMLDELLAGTHPKGSAEQIVADFYRTGLDIKSRNAQGIQPIKKYLDRIENARTLDELLDAETLVHQETGLTWFLDPAYLPDFNGLNNISLYFGSNAPEMDEWDYKNQSDQYKARRQYMIDLQVLAGMSHDAAAAAADSRLKIEQALSSTKLSAEEMNDFRNMYKKIKFSELEKIYSKINLRKIFEDRGITLDGDPDIYFAYQKTAHKASLYLKEEYLPILKSYAKIGLLIDSNTMLSEDFIQATEKYYTALYGEDGSYPFKQRVINRTLDVLGDYVGQLYAKRYASPQAKSGARDILNDILAVYKKRISTAGWMTELTKSRAINNLNAISVKVSHPAELDDILGKREIKTYENGGSYFRNTGTVLAARCKDYTEIAKRSGKLGMNKWHYGVLEGNVVLIHNEKSITVPAPTLQPPFYDKSAPSYINYSGAGAVIGGVLNYAINADGAEHDANGYRLNWWQPSDYERFGKLEKKVAAYYDKVEAAPGILTNGENTARQNIADIAGLAVALEAAKTKPGYNAKKFFENYARTWYCIATREYVKDICENGAYQYDSVRVNQVLRNFDEFHEAFGIKEGDGMYLAPEKRITVW